MNNKFNAYKHNYELLSIRLNGLSPTAKLVGGFGYIENKDKPVTDIKDVKIGDKLDITIKGGRIETVVEGVNNIK